MATSDLKREAADLRAVMAAWRREDLQEAAPGTIQEMAVDFTRGDILAQVVRTPTLRERVRQAGPVGAVIIVALLNLLVPADSALHVSSYTVTLLGERTQVLVGIGITELGQAVETTTGVAVYLDVVDQRFDRRSTERAASTPRERCRRRPTPVPRSAGNGLRNPRCRWTRAGCRSDSGRAGLDAGPASGS